MVKVPADSALCYRGAVLKCVDGAVATVSCKVFLVENLMSCGFISQRYHQGGFRGGKKFFGSTKPSWFGNDMFLCICVVGVAGHEFHVDSVGGV